MRLRYSEPFKARMVQRLTAPNGPTALDLSEEVGVPNGTLSRWVREAASLGEVAKKEKKTTTPSAGERAPRSLRQWTPAEKLRVVTESTQLSDEELGEFLRREGLQTAQLEQWRAEILAALGAPAPNKSSNKKALRKLERELARKEKALAEVTALLVLKKKVDALFGQEDEGDSTTPSSDDE